jgi:hypothetical protein
MSDWVSKELSTSAKSLSDSRECFIEVCINNRSLFIIEYLFVSCHPRLPRQVNYIEKYGTALSLSLSLSVSVSLSLSPGVSQKTLPMYMNLMLDHHLQKDSAANSHKLNHRHITTKTNGWE